MWYGGREWVENSTELSINPTISSNKFAQVYPSVFHLAWQENTNYSQVKYCALKSDNTNNITISAYQTPSDNCTYTRYYNPNITVGIDGVKLIFLGEAWFGGGYYPDVKIFYKSHGGNYLFGNSYSKYGSDNMASSPVIQWANFGVAIAWSETNWRVTPNTVSDKYLYNGSINTFTTTGKQIQLCNNTSTQNMRAVSFQNKTLPYSFTTTKTLSGLAKDNPIDSTFMGKDAIVIKDDVSFVYSISNLTFNEKPVKFKGITNDSVVYNSIDKFNESFISEPFTLNDNSNLSYQISSFISDSSKALELLNNGKYVSYKLQLIDAISGKELTALDKTLFDKSTLDVKFNRLKSFDVKGFNGRQVKLKMNVEENVSGNYIVGTSYTDNKLPDVDGSTEIYLENNQTIDSYELFTNYPNPFNPSTTIKYQLPEEGFVTLKIYDMLGQEVLTLVNELKNKGRYTSVFDASNLSSGTYIYELKVNSFRKSQKMMLVK